MAKRTAAFVALVGILAALLIVPGTARGGLIYTGTLEAPVLLGSPGIEGTGVWVPPSPGEPVTTLTWTVSRESENDPWLYCYDFSTTAQGGLSHFVIEVTPPGEGSPGFTEDDIIEGSASASYELDWATSANGNTNIPGPLYGLKFAGNAQAVDQICLESFNDPVWGDFYAKDGSAGGQGTNTAWNAGFLDPDPIAPYSADPADMNFHVLRPDTNGGDEPPSPEPAGLGLLGVALLAMRRRRS